mgnify:CR=1 FL=1
MKRNKIAGYLLVAAVALIAGFEGVKQTAYQDIGGVWTICFGETKGVSEGDTATFDQCLDMLSGSIKLHNSPLESLPELPPNVHLAALDFCYNVGIGNCSTSTLFKYLKRGDYYGAADQLLRWKYAAKVDCSDPDSECHGVWRRRLIERELMRGDITIEQAIKQIGALEYAKEEENKTY